MCIPICECFFFFIIIIIIPFGIFFRCSRLRSLRTVCVRGTNLYLQSEYIALALCNDNRTHYYVWVYKRTSIRTSTSSQLYDIAKTIQYHFNYVFVSFACRNKIIPTTTHCSFFFPFFFTERFKKRLTFLGKIKVNISYCLCVLSNKILCTLRIKKRFNLMRRILVYLSGHVIKQKKKKWLLNLSFLIIWYIRWKLKLHKIVTLNPNKMLNCFRKKNYLHNSICITMTKDSNRYNLRVTLYYVINIMIL